MFLFRNKHVYNYIYKYVHAYMRVYPYSQKCRIKIQSWRRLQLLRLWSLYMFPTGRICNTKSQGSYWVRRLGTISVIGHGSEQQTLTFWRVDFCIVQIYLRTGHNVWQPSALQVKEFGSIVISTPFGLVDTVRNLRKKNTWWFFKWGWTSLHLTLYIKGCDMATPESLTWIVVILHHPAKTYDATLSFGDGIFSHDSLKQGVSINSWIGKINSWIGKTSTIFSIAWEKKPNLGVNTSFMGQSQ